MKKKILLIDLSVLFALMLVYYYIIYFVASDIPSHALFIKNYADGTQSFPTNFLYYLVIFLFSFCSNNIQVLVVTSFFILVIITYIKYLLSKRIIKEQILYNDKSAELIATISATALIFCFSLPSIFIIFGKFYFMSYPANVWHNSTTIFVMPFVILLFWQSLKQLEHYSSKRDYLIFLLIIINIAVKPSFIFVYLIVYPILLLQTYGLNKIFFKGIFILFIVSVVIFIEYYFIYVNSDSIKSPAESSVRIDFMHILYITCKNNWFYTTVFFTSTFVSSFLFPIIFLYKNKQLLKEKMIQFALLNVAFSIIISCFLYEHGKREMSGNFYWQIFMCTYLLFMVCVIQLLKLIFNNTKSYKPFKIELTLFALHVLAGIVYLFKIVITDSII